MNLLLWLLTEVDSSIVSSNKYLNLVQTDQIRATIISFYNFCVTTKIKNLAEN